MCIHTSPYTHAPKGFMIIYYLIVLCKFINYYMYPITFKCDGARDRGGEHDHRYYKMLI